MRDSDLNTINAAIDPGKTFKNMGVYVRFS